MRTNGGSFESHLVFIPVKGPPQKSTIADIKREGKYGAWMHEKKDNSFVIIKEAFCRPSCQIQELAKLMRSEIFMAWVFQLVCMFNFGFINLDFCIVYTFKCAILQFELGPKLYIREYTEAANFTHCVTQLMLYTGDKLISTIYSVVCQCVRDW